jgi:hypothetical protein
LLQLDELYRLLDELRNEAVQAAEYPREEDRTAFGFGRVAGMLEVLRVVRERIEEKVEEVEK